MQDWSKGTPDENIYIGETELLLHEYKGSQIDLHKCQMKST